jgi:hypothetical protein
MGLRQKVKTGELNAAALLESLHLANAVAPGTYHPRILRWLQNRIAR